MLDARCWGTQYTLRVDFLLTFLIPARKAAKVNAAQSRKEMQGLNALLMYFFALLAFIPLRSLREMYFGTSVDLLPAHLLVPLTISPAYDFNY